MQSRQVVQIFHSHITEAFTKLEVSTPQAKNRYSANLVSFLCPKEKLKGLKYVPFLAYIVHCTSLSLNYVLLLQPRLCRDVQHILTCIRKLPAENFTAETIRNYGLLDEFLAENFGTKVGE